MITATGTREKGRESLKGKWGKGVLITFCYLLIEFIISTILNIFENNDAIILLLTIANTVISIPLSFGLLISFLKLKRNEEISGFDFIKIGFSNFSRSWKVFFSILRKLLLPIILFVIAYVLIVITIGLAIFETATNLTAATSTVTSGGSMISLALLSIVLFIVSSIWTFVKSLYYVLSNFIAFDNPNMTTKEAVERSQELMTGNRGNYFVLTLSFIGWAILSVLTLGIGFLWLIPYIQVTTACFYEQLNGKNNSTVEAEVVENDEPIK